MHLKIKISKLIVTITKKMHLKDNKTNVNSNVLSSDSMRQTTIMNQIYNAYKYE